MESLSSKFSNKCGKATVSKSTVERLIISRQDYDVHVSICADLFWFIIASVKNPIANVDRVTDSIYKEILSVIPRNNIIPVHERIFCSLDTETTIKNARDNAVSGLDSFRTQPLTIVAGRPLWGEGLAGIQIWGLNESRLQSSIMEVSDSETNTKLGKTWVLNGNQFIVLQNLMDSSQIGNSPEEFRENQADLIFEKANRTLKQAGFSYKNVVRTWIYISRILDWYNSFNIVRNRKYASFGLRPTSSQETDGAPLPLPASTGIQGENSKESACVMDLLAIRPTNINSAVVTHLTNIKQKDAYKYGAAFSRGVCIKHDECTEIQVSGTAAIDRSGKSMYSDDPAAQISATIDNIEALLAPLKASISDFVSGTIFFKRPEDVDFWAKEADKRGLKNLPVVSVIADICRPELLFEMDGVAFSK